MLDADNLPLRNPEVLFDTREYRRSGTLFFSDWWDMTEWVKPQAYNAFGLPYPGDEAALLAQESGQLLFNRHAPVQAAAVHSGCPLYLRGLEYNPST